MHDPLTPAQLFMCLFILVACVAIGYLSQPYQYGIQEAARHPWQGSDFLGNFAGAGFGDPRDRGYRPRREADYGAWGGRR